MKDKRTSLLVSAFMQKSWFFVSNLIFFLVSTFIVQKDHKYVSTISEIICLFTQVICTIQVIKSYASFKIICIIQVISLITTLVWLNTPSINYNMILGHMFQYTIQYDLAKFLTRSCALQYPCHMYKYISTTSIYFSTPSNYMHQYTVKSSWISYSRNHA